MLGPRGIGLTPSQKWFRIAVATAVGMNLYFARNVYLSATTERWSGVIFGLILWNLFPGVLFAIAAVLKKDGR